MQPADGLVLGITPWGGALWDGTALARRGAEAVLRAERNARALAWWRANTHSARRFSRDGGAPDTRLQGVSLSPARPASIGEVLLPVTVTRGYADPVDRRALRRALEAYLAGELRRG